MRSRHRSGFVAVVLAAVVSISACESDAPGDAPSDAGAGDGQDAATPAPEVELFTDGDFDDIPKPRGATEASTKTEHDGAIAQSFTVTATSPTELMDFFATQLPLLGWEVVEPVRSTGTDSFAAAWTRDERRLEISALLAQGVADEESQFSVVLLPGLVPGEEINDADQDDADQ